MKLSYIFLSLMFCHFFPPSLISYGCVQIYLPFLTFLKPPFFLKLRKKHFKQKSENGTCESITLEKSVYMHFAILNRKLVDEWIDCNLPTKANKNSLVVTLVSFLLLWENTKTKSSTEDKEPLYFRFPFSTQKNTYLSKTHIQSRAEKNDSLTLVLHTSE